MFGGSLKSDFHAALLCSALCIWDLGSGVCLCLDLAPSLQDPKRRGRFGIWLWLQLINAVCFLPFNTFSNSSDNDISQDG